MQQRMGAAIRESADNLRTTRSIGGLPSVLEKWRPSVTLERCATGLVRIAILIWVAGVQAQGLPVATPEDVGMSGQRLERLAQPLAVDRLSGKPSKLIGYGGTYFWLDPQEQISAVYMSQTPSPKRAYYRKLFKQHVYAAILD